jgi:transposase
MIALTAETTILLATKPADFRKGIDGFVALCRDQLKQNTRSGTWFVFINRNKTMMRILVWDHTGFWLMTKRLSKGKFSGWPKDHHLINTVDARSLSQLLSGC